MILGIWYFDSRYFRYYDVTSRVLFSRISFDLLEYRPVSVNTKCKVSCIVCILFQFLNLAGSSGV